MWIVPLGPNLRRPSLQLAGPLMNSNMPSKLMASGSSSVVIFIAVKWTSRSRLVEVYSTGRCDEFEELHRQPRGNKIESW